MEALAIENRTLQELIAIAFCILVCGTAGWTQEDRPAYAEPPLALGEGISPQTNLLEGQMIGVPGQAGESPTLSDVRESGQFVVAKSPTDTWSLNERFYHFGIGQALTIPETGFAVPRDLWTVDGGVAYNHRLSGNRSFGLNLNIGSDSDEPFHSIHETALRATANYRIPSGAENAWLFFLNYSNNRHFLNGIPLPGFAYFFNTDDRRLQGLVGFPFAALRYKPTPDWTLQASIFGPRNFNAEIARRIVGPLRGFTAFQWSSQEWMPADRADNADRLFFDRKRVFLGVRSPLAHQLSLEIAGGRQFDARFFVNSSSSYSSVPTVGIAPAWFMEAKLSWRFRPEVVAK